MGVLSDISPTIEPLPADWSAYMDLTGSLKFWDRDPQGLAALLRLRTLALHGVQTTCAIAPNRMLATMAAAVTPPGMTTVIDAKDVERWLRPRPVAALYGVGPATAGKLRTYGLHTIGDTAKTPMSTLVRLFGAAGRTLHAHAHAHGQDPRTVQTQPIAKSLAADGALNTTSWTPPNIAEPCSIWPRRSPPACVTGSKPRADWPCPSATPTAA
ncbi:hypothetical protein ACF1G0_34785 [Streptomyces sp. NPDC013953]|uniref:hypothetical protein n=1 Tax=Streptomyces sp. NPDC013953 TaxID=3364868 RepID=UPI0037000A38